MNDYLDYYTKPQIDEMFNYQTFTPFEDPDDRRSVRNITYLICREKPDLYSEGFMQSRKKSKDDCIEIYAPIDDETYACIAYADFHFQKIKNDSDMLRLFPDKPEAEQLKLDYLFTAEPYRGLGLASMMIAMLQDECRLKGVPIFRLDSLKDYVFTEDGVEDKNDIMYRKKGFIEIPGDYSKDNVRPKFLLITQVESAREFAESPQYKNLVDEAPVDYAAERDAQIITFDNDEEEVEEFIEYGRPHHIYDGLLEEDDDDILIYDQPQSTSDTPQPDQEPSSKKPTEPLPPLP